MSVTDSMDFYGNPDPAIDSSITVTVEVTNLEEPGKLFLSSYLPKPGSYLPKPGSEVSAILSDPDGGITGATWRWEESQDKSWWTDIPGATSASFTPSTNLVGSYLRTSVTYTDGQGPGKNASRVSVNTVRDLPRPTMTAIAITSSPIYDGKYRVGEALEITYTFSEPVRLYPGLEPSVLFLVPGDRCRRARHDADLSQKAGGNKLVFSWVVESELDGELWIGPGVPGNHTTIRGYHGNVLVDSKMEWGKQAEN